MTTFLALLRGVNVGKAKRVPMGEFRKMLEGLGFTGVTTLLNSGNAIFRAASNAAAKHAASIKGEIAKRLQLDVPVVVKSADELAAIVSENPFADSADDASRLLVAFVQDRRALATLAPIAELVAGEERFKIGAEAAYLYCPNGILKSKSGEALLGRTGRAATTRNWATTLKLFALATGSARA